MRRQDELWHWGVKGMKWGVRRYQNKDGTLTTAGKKHYGEDGADGANTGAEVTEYAPKVSKKKVGDYSDEELRAQINRMQMEKQYRDLSGQTNVREDDPNRELKLQRERLQLQRDVKNLKKEINGGQTFVKTVFNTAGRVGFSTLSDHLKRRETVYQVIFIMSIAVCLLQIFTNSIGNALLWAVLAMLFLVNAGYGGGFSTLPVLLDQHFGTKTVSTTHGLTLSAWAFAGLSGNQLASFVVAHAPDQAHRYAALIPVLTGLFVVALISISLVKYLGDRNVTKAVEDRG